MKKKFEDIIQIESLQKDDKSDPMSAIKATSGAVSAADPKVQEHQRLLSHYEKLAPEKVVIPHSYVPDMIRNRNLPGPDLMRMMKLTDHEQNKSIRPTYDYASVLEHPNFGKEHFDHYMKQMKEHDMGNPMSNDLIYKLHQGKFKEHMNEEHASELLPHHLNSAPHLAGFIKQHGHHLKSDHIGKIVSHISNTKQYHADYGRALEAVESHPNFDGSHVHSLLDTPYSSFAYNSRKIAPKLLDSIVDNIGEYSERNHEVGDAIASNPALTGEHAHKLVQNYLDNGGEVNSGSRDAAKLAVKNGKYDPEKLKEVLGHKHLNDLARYALENPKIGKDHISAFLSNVLNDTSDRTYSHAVGKAISHSEANTDHVDQVWQAHSGNHETLPDRFYTSPHLGKKHLDHLFQTAKNSVGDEDKEDSLLHHVHNALDNPNIDEDHLNIASQHPSDLIRERAEEIARIHGHYEDPDKVQVRFGTTKLREARDLASKSADKRIHKKDLEKAGYNPKDLGISHLQDPKGFIHHDHIHDHIENQPSMQYGYSHSQYGEDLSDYENEVERARDEYEQEFDPSDYGVDKSSYVDEERAKRHHSSQFNWDDYENSDEADMAYDDHMEMFDPEDYEDHEDDNIFNRQRYEDDWQSSFDEHMSRFSPSDRAGIDHDTVEEAYESNLSGQQHSLRPSEVFQLNLTKDHAKRLKEAGVFKTFQSMSQESHNSNHPAKYGNGIGWVRYTHADDGVHIDEIQSDFGQSMYRQAQRQARQLIDQGSMTQEEAEGHLAQYKAKYPDEHFDKINEIIFGGKHSNEVLHEAFKQHLRDKGHAGKPVHMWQAKPKGKISGMSERDDLPAHMQFTYHQNPKKMGYKPAKYGQISTQENPHLQDEPTWSHILKKARRVLNTLNKTLGKPK